MDVEQGNSELRNLTRRSGHRVRNVVEFRVGEHRQTEGHDFLQSVGTECGEELEPDLQAAHSPLQAARRHQRPVQVSRIERGKNRVGESDGGHWRGVIGSGPCLGKHR